MRAEGLLMNAYTRLPTNSYSFNDVATDDAVTNNKQNSFLQMATGQWSAMFNPMDQWNNSYTAILYLNKFLQSVDSVEWSYTSDEANRLFAIRHTGEAYGLRALFMLNLLRSHGGYSSGNILLGVPIIVEPLDNNAEAFAKPRNTFEECMQQIYSDLAKAIEILPLEYANARNAGAIPPHLRGFSLETYNRVMGEFNRQRLSGAAAMAIRAQAALLAASPAFSSGTTTTWEDAANHAASLLNLIEGVSGLDNVGHLFYTPAGVTRFTGDRQTEMAWRGSRIDQSLDRERENFPPSLFGNGRVNPTRNLVDAFPMANGYPIDHANSGYDPSNPYNNRDPRLRHYIVVNGDTLAGQAVYTAMGSGNDAVDFLPTSTRTGYYMRKLLREDVNVNPANQVPQRQIVPHIRYTEIFLAYAEAANEAWGPDGSGVHGYSARDVIQAIRERAGIEQPDTYLASITTTEGMRMLIRNERRLELCFEGFRFWDLRRWKESITTPAMGVRIENSTYQVTVVENRLYESFMLFPPVPYSEVLKFGFEQNNGW